MKNTRGTLRRRERERSILIFLFLLLPMVLSILLAVYPVLSVFFYSLTDWGGVSRPGYFVGLGDYIKVFTTQKYWNVFQAVVYYLVAGLTQQVVALFLATILYKGLRGSNFFKGVIFFPFITNTVTVTLILQVFFEISGGLDSILTMLGQEAWIRKWIAGSSVVNTSLASIYLQKNIGYGSIIYLDIMQSVPKDLHEAAEIDETNSWVQFQAITLPNIKMIIGFLVTFVVVNSVAIFDIPFILTKGQNRINTFTATLIETAFKFDLYGGASAMAIVPLMVVAVVLVFENTVFKEED